RWPTGSASGFGRARVNKTRRRGGQSGRLQTPQSPSRLAHSRPHLPNSLRAPHSSPPPAASAAAPATRPASLAMTTSRRLADRKIARFEKNVTKRGAVPETIKKANDYPFGPILLGFFVFIVVGSSLFQIIRTASNAGLF
ncbi:hypothetical protein PVAP13_2NG559603, partial [Panicum virgatum]